MDKIRQWTLTISAVSMISGLLLCILPKSSQKNFFKVIVSVTMLYAVMHPLINSKGVDFRIDEFLSDNYQLSENYDKYAVSAMIKSAENAIEDTLKSKALNLDIDCYFECSCEMENEEIVVDEIVVIMQGTTEKKGVISEMICGLGFDETRVVFKGE